MKIILLLLGVICLLGTTGCEIEEHEHRGGYYGPGEYGHYHEYHPWHRDWDDRY